MDNKIILVLLATAFVFLILIFLVNFILSYQKKTIAFTKEKELMQTQFDQTLLQSQIEVQEATFSVLAKELNDNLTTEIKRINAGLVLEIHFSHPAKLSLPVDEQIILFRIIQEALQNAIKHAEAKNICIEIETQTENIIIVITDDGRGFK